jgi:hypothetical protein
MMFYFSLRGSKVIYSHPMFGCPCCSTWRLALSSPQKPSIFSPDSINYRPKSRVPESMFCFSLRGLKVFNHRYDVWFLSACLIYQVHLSISRDTQNLLWTQILKRHMGDADVLFLSERIRRYTPMVRVWLPTCLLKIPSLPFFLSKVLNILWSWVFKVSASFGYVLLLPARIKRYLPAFYVWLFLSYLKIPSPYFLLLKSSKTL